MAASEINFIYSRSGRLICESDRFHGKTEQLPRYIVIQDWSTSICWVVFKTTVRAIGSGCNSGALKETVNLRGEKSALDPGQLVMKRDLITFYGQEGAVVILVRIPPDTTFSVLGAKRFNQIFRYMLTIIVTLPFAMRHTCIALEEPINFVGRNIKPGHRRDIPVKSGLIKISAGQHMNLQEYDSFQYLEPRNPICKAHIIKSFLLQ